MRRFTVVPAVALLVLAFAGTALAGAHFQGTPTATVSGNTLTVTFDAAGLGNANTAVFTLAGDVIVGSRCYTRKGNTPQAANKQETLEVNDSEDFAVKNGRTIGSFTITPLSTLTCPGGQRVVIESVDFSDLVLTGPGGLSYSF